MRPFPWRHRLYLFVAGFAHLIDGLIQIATLGSRVGSCSVALCRYYTGYTIRRQRTNRKEIQP
jgi:hypothetical protein